MHLELLSPRETVPEQYNQALLGQFDQEFPEEYHEAEIQLFLPPFIERGAEQWNQFNQEFPEEPLELFGQEFPQKNYEAEQYNQALLKRVNQEFPEPTSVPIVPMETDAALSNQALLDQQQVFEQTIIEEPNTPLFLPVISTTFTRTRVPIKEIRLQEMQDIIRQNFHEILENGVELLNDQQQLLSAAINWIDSQQTDFLKKQTIQNIVYFDDTNLQNPIRKYCASGVREYLSGEISLVEEYKLNCKETINCLFNLTNKALISKRVLNYFLTEFGLDKYFLLTIYTLLKQIKPTCQWRIEYLLNNQQYLEFQFYRAILLVFLIIQVPEYLRTMQARVQGDIARTYENYERYVEKQNHSVMAIQIFLFLFGEGSLGNESAYYYD